MSTNYSFKADGAVIIRVRVAKRVNGSLVEVVGQKRIISDLFISEKDWFDYHKLQSVNAREKFLERNPKFADSIGRLQEIRKRIDACGADMNTQKMEDIINVVMNAEQIERER